MEFSDTEILDSHSSWHLGSAPYMGQVLAEWKSTIQYLELWAEAYNQGLSSL